MAVTIPACSVPLEAAFQHVGRMQHNGRALAARTVSLGTLPSGERLTLLPAE